MLLLLLLVFGGIIALEVPGLVRKQMWGELAAFGFLLALGMVLSVAEVLDIPLPNPTKFIEAVFKPVADAIDKALMVK
ncbi:hypothetical protein SY88_14590 [Clostridiales bacterium PH28_bin88]|nr:hypothetical protein SY88_14590 [Clostridiales bacterium PH28_bin88]